MRTRPTPAGTGGPRQQGGGGQARPRVSRTVPASSTTRHRPAGGLDDAQQGERGGHGRRGGEDGGAEDQLLGQAEGATSCPPGRRPAAHHDQAGAEEQGDLDGDPGPGAQPAPVDQRQDRPTMASSVAGNGRHPAEHRTAGAGRRALTRVSSAPETGSSGATASSRQRAAGRVRPAAATTGRGRERGRRRRRARCPAGAQGGLRGGQRAAERDRHGGGEQPPSTGVHTVLSACSPSVTSRRPRPVTRSGGVPERVRPAQPQMAPWAAEPTSFAYLPSTPVV